MKLSLKFLAIAMVFVSFLTSCQKDAKTLLETPEQTEELTEENIDAWVNAHRTEVTVETATLEEINEVMLSYGLEPFTESDVERASKVMTVIPCDYADWNGSGTLTTFDLVLAQQYICNNAGSCAGDVPTSTASPLEVFQFGVLSFYGNDGAEALTLNRNDIYLARDAILGVISCN